MGRTAKTRAGEVVEIGKMRHVGNGWVSYVLHPNGYAILVFIPADKDVS